MVVFIKILLSQFIREVELNPYKDAKKEYKKLLEQGWENKYF
tara:strand:+ start:522 stop:647 length:126 start_codon:yes stop_codon:yes gene_type:complete